MQPAYTLTRRSLLRTARPGARRRSPASARGGRAGRGRSGPPATLRLRRPRRAALRDPVGRSEAAVGLRPGGGSGPTSRWPAVRTHSCSRSPARSTPRSRPAPTPCGTRGSAVSPLFVAPVGQPGADRRYEAVIDRSVGAPKSPPKRRAKHARAPEARARRTGCSRSPHRSGARLAASRRRCAGRRRGVRATISSCARQWTPCRCTPA